MNFQTTFAAFIEAAQDPSAGAHVYDAYAADASIYCEFEIRPRDAFDRDAFATLQQAASELHALEKPGVARRPELRDIRQISATFEGDDRAVVWFSADEAQDGQELAIAVGFLQESDTWKIEWLTLAPSPQPWTYAMGRAQMLADSVYGRALLDVLPRTWLDLAYHREYGYARPPLVTLPEARFSCAGSGVCCSIDWAIKLPSDAQQVLDAVPWDELGRPDLADARLTADEDGQLLLKEDGAPCRYLDEHRHCLLHKNFGRAIFSPCASYPFSFKATPDGVAVAASPMCSTARANLGLPLTERQDDLYRRLAMIGLDTATVPGTYFLNSTTPLDWPSFKAAEGVLLEWLGRDDLPIRRRLWVGSRYLTSLVTGAEPDWETWLAEGPDPLPEQHYANAASLVERVATSLRVWNPSPLYGAAPSPLPLDRVIANVLRNVVHAKYASFGGGLILAFNLGVLITMLAERLQAEGAPEAAVVELTKRMLHGDLIKRLTRQETEEYRELHRILDMPMAGTWFLSALPEVGAIAVGQN